MLVKNVSHADYNIINKNIEDFIPTNIILYPLARQGERLPFIDETAEGFIVGNAKNETELFAAYLEGVAFVERWCYELMEDLGAPTGDLLYSTGGGSANAVWTRIRASALKRQIIKPAITECAMGTAIIAASRTLFSSLAEASKAMVKQDIKIDPDPHLANLYDEKYALFRNECSARDLGNKT